MDTDEALARQLQAEEDAVHHLAVPGGITPDEFIIPVRVLLDKALRIEDPGLRSAMRGLVPLARLRADAASAIALNLSLGEPMGYSLQDLLAQGLLKWFKNSFFTWVDTVPCERCGGPTVGTGVGQESPTAAERAGQAARVELHHCRACDLMSRFPRYNDVRTLMRTRRGRCGEWAHCFLLVLRAAGLVARFTVDWADHVWNEYYSHAMQRWVHLDACECAFDKPLLYEAGWGKHVSYVVSAGASGVSDVSRRYTRHWREVLDTRRIELPEAVLAAQLREMNVRLCARLPRRWLHRRLQRQLVEELVSHTGGALSGTEPMFASHTPGEALRRPHKRLHRVGVTTAVAGLFGGAYRAAVAAQQAAAAAGGAAGEWELQRSARLNDQPGVAEEALPGRQTGSLEWRSTRGEGGRSSPPAVEPPAASRAGGGGSSTPYVLAGDASLPPVFATFGLVRGGACRAAGHNSPAESVERLFDGGVGSKWLDFGGGSSWVEYRILAASAPACPTHYALVSANDSPERDPCAWVLEAWEEGLAAQGHAQQLLGSSSSSSSNGSSSSDDSSAGSGGSAPPADGTASPAESSPMPSAPASHGHSSVPHWRELDRRQGASFTERNQLLCFQVPPPSHTHAHAVHRRFRLRVLSLRDPVSANSVQLACWQIYHTPASHHPSGPQQGAQILGADTAVAAAAAAATAAAATAAAAAALLIPASTAATGPAVAEGAAGSDRDSVTVPAHSTPSSMGDQSPLPARESDAGVSSHKSLHQQEERSSGGKTVQRPAQVCVGLLAADPATAKLIQTMARVAFALRDKPAEPKFRRLRASKLVGLLGSVPAVQLLARLGFCPLLLPDPDGPTGAVCSFLVCGAQGSEGLEEVCSALAPHAQS
ncbi:MAG: hypothetical protein WDW36_006731 [Sanguina aurantia]